MATVITIGRLRPEQEPRLQLLRRPARPHVRGPP
eukprot:CAMPEP_0174330586 /NCGR_PEP_ID=MMETSP0810-20121108/16805_1 /TAXON_ID=73025 ORGANISM="Eutreptiella gymnastica-like, Strain CCMP1594" /NCGR_SAMPLE_ID=MMETSP0810 /ASSEMBLY_ACC=CAM_ASM_000659 /LENGTH=33 /DNA_ID= /DNA_START= /DNA_END= /DNA_ORIENTATION=